MTAKLSITKPNTYIWKNNLAIFPIIKHHIALYSVGFCTAAVDATAVAYACYS